jgi:hypothetical protein
MEQRRSPEDKQRVALGEEISTLATRLSDQDDELTFSGVLEKEMATKLLTPFKESVPIDDFTKDQISVSVDINRSKFHLKRHTAIRITIPTEFGPQNVELSVEKGKEPKVKGLISGKITTDTNLTIFSNYYEKPRTAQLSELQTFKEILVHFETESQSH